MRQPGIVEAFGAAILFGAGTPLAKLLLHTVDPWLLASLLYLGSGLGLTIYRWLARSAPVRMRRSEILWFAGAIVSGGVIAPVLLMIGLVRMPASGASLLLNGESVFTALLAWFVFKENFDRRVALGMLVIVAGAAILAWPSKMHFSGVLPALAVLGACFAWGIDNNLTRKVSLTDATWIASIKGLAAGVVNLALALSMGTSIPSWPTIVGSMTIGLLAYGASLALFVVALRHLGTARTGAYFSIAPFFGALLALALGDSLTTPVVVAALLMAVGVWLHLSERHQHEHVHEPLEHEHEHVHDGDPHHEHEHEQPVEAGTRHRHAHRHTALRHSHPHYPDAHHRHDH
jgi:drug/metabolite transporter (DMT)-like permease